MVSRKLVLMNPLQGSNGYADIDSRLVDAVVEGEGGTSSESNMETYELPYVK